MKSNARCVCSAIVTLCLSLAALAQVSVTGGSRDIQPTRSVDIAAVEAKLQTAAEMMRAHPPRYEEAIATLTEARQMAPDQDAVWYRLGVAYLGSASAQTDAAEKEKRSTEAYRDLEQAIDVYEQRKTHHLQQNVKLACNVEGVCTHVEPLNAEITENRKLAVYYSNLGDAAARLGKNEEASKNFQRAAQLDPTDAATYYFDLGIVLRNSAKSMDDRKRAVEAFDKAIAADPNKAADYYLKGELLFAMINTDSKGKIIPQPGTAEALQKYLELQPNGPYAQQAKGLLAALDTSGSDDGTGKRR